MRGGFHWVDGLTWTGSFELVRGFCGWIGEADVKILDCGANYWVAKGKLQSKLWLQVVVRVLFDPHHCRVTRVFCPIVGHRIRVTFANIVHMALPCVKEAFLITDGAACGDDGVNVESVVWPPVVILTIYWIVVWFVSGGLSPNLKALP